MYSLIELAREWNILVEWRAIRDEVPTRVAAEALRAVLRCFSRGSSPQSLSLRINRSPQRLTKVLFRCCLMFENIKRTHANH